MHPGPGLVLTENKFRIQVGMIVQCQQVIGAAVRKVRLQLKRSGIIFQCFLELPPALEAATDVVDHVRPVGLQPQDLSKVLDRLIEIPALLEQHP